MPRFMRKGTTEFWWVNTISNKLAPTAAELNAGTEITAQIAAVNGFSFSNSPIMTPDMDTVFVSQISGEDTAEESNLELYKLTGTDSIYALMDKNETGFVCIAPVGKAGASWAAADKVDVWPSTVASKSQMYTADNEAAKYRVAFAITSTPTLDYAVAS